MRRSRPWALAAFCPCLLLAFFNMFRISEDVRVIDVIRLTTGGAALGVAATCGMFFLSGRVRTSEAKEDTAGRTPPA
jgi:hypothetical protein